MNLIFLTLSNVTNISNRGIYTDLMRKFRDEGHSVHIVSPCERRTGQNTHIINSDGVKILKVRTLNIQKTNIVEKGIGTILIESQYKLAIKKHWADIQFDLILYSTPPITFTKVIRYLKLHSPNTISYLLLKDIFPQNAVDIGLFSKKSLFYKYFRHKEKLLYRLSDFIGCMSPANVEYIRRQNPSYTADHVEVAPNSIDLNVNLDLNHKKEIREKYGLPVDKPILIYGGNLGKPQGINFLIQCLEANKHRTDCHFLIIGTGTEFPKLKAWYKNLNPNENDKQVKVNNKDEEKVKVKVDKNITLMEGLPKAEYDQLVQSCDVGMIFLDHRFTIPNYPSRLLSYLENKMPVICATDRNTDIGSIAEQNGYGYWCESVNPDDFTALVDKMLASNRTAMGERGYQILLNNYLVEHTYNAIMRHVNKRKEDESRRG